MAKSKSKWVVAVSKSDSLQVLYEGQDRTKARAVVEKALGSGGQKEVQVWRVTRSVTLTAADLVSSLPRASF